MFEIIQGGGVTTALGFKAGAVSAGLKMETGVLDMGLLVSDMRAAVAATFTTNSIESPSVTVSRRRLKKGYTRGVIANSGCANCAVGSQGLLDAEEMSSLAADSIGVESDELFVASTGMIGVELPMALIRQNMGNIVLTESGGTDFSKSIMTTDSHNKEIAVSFTVDGKSARLGGAAKGVGMIHPNMATMLCFMTTDANVEPQFLQDSLSEAVGGSFNMIDVDGDQSTNDTEIILANGASGSSIIEKDTDAAMAFTEALRYVTTELAKELVRDGEGAQRLMEVMVEGALTSEEAKKAARSVVSSLLVKSMLHGQDPNWGRIMMAIGKAGVQLDENKLDIYVSDIHIVHQGVAIPYYKDAVVSAMGSEEVTFRVALNLGQASAVAWGCDLTEEYVIFNSAYST